MFHYNTCRRVSVYDHPAIGEGIDHCYDCTCEATILRGFVRRRHSNKSEESQLSLVQKLSLKLSRTYAFVFLFALACVRVCVRGCLCLCRVLQFTCVSVWVDVQVIWRTRSDHGH